VVFYPKAKFASIVLSGNVIFEEVEEGMIVGVKEEYIYN
jgi:hypothetical protein